MTTLTAEFVEREYNARARVPEHPAYFARWADDSQRVRETLACHLDVRYGPGPKETMDVFPATSARATLVFIHGGYWRALDKSDHSWIAPPFVAAGYSVVMPNYDLCPDVSIDRIVAEQRQAVAWLHANGHLYGAPTERVVLSGHSAGGHLVAMLYATEWHAWNVSPRALRGGVAISGLFDLEPMRLFAFNADFRLDAEAAERLSPVNLAPRIGAPLVIAVGAEESGEFVRQSRDLWDAWPDVRPPSSHGPMIVPGRHHFSVVDALAEPGHPLHRAALDLLG